MSKTCLVVDDSRVVRKVACRILEDYGFKCEEAEDGHMAREACDRQMPDAILLDWVMPHVSGYDFLKQLRAMPGGDTPKVIFCTTEHDVRRIQQALDAGADEYIMKPFDGEIIAIKLEQVGLIG